MQPFFWQPVFAENFLHSKTLSPMKRTTILLAAFALLLFHAPGFSQKVVNESFEGINEIEMSISSGDVIFEKSGDNRVTIEMTSTFEAYDPTIEKRGDVLRIDEEKMRNIRNWSGNVTWTIKIPNDLEIDHNTGSGDVSITGLQLKIRMNSGSGSFRISGSGGEMRINTGSGDIRVTKATGRLDFNCGSGDIDISEVNAAVEANVGSGDIEVSGLSLTGKSTFNSGSGDVEVTLAQPLAYDISANSGSGDARLNFNGHKIDGLVTMEANKQNGDIEAPFEFDSTEEIDRGDNTRVRKTRQMGSSNVKINVSTGSGTAEIKAE